MFLMEKNMMQIYKEKYPHGSYSVYGEHGNDGSLVLSDYSYGSDVEGFWGSDEIEYYLIISKDEVPKFLLNCLTKGFNSEEKFNIHELENMCDEKGIKYRTNCYV